MSEAPLNSASTIHSVTGPGSRSIRSNGEMAARIISLDWSSTPLGPIDSWSTALLVTVNTILAAPYPSALFWGTDLRMIYNDSYRDLLGAKHPAALGTSAPSIWSDAWHTLQPDVMKVMRGEGSAVQKDVLVPVNRTGVLKEECWNYYLSPVVKDDLSIAAILVTCQEVTSAVLPERLARASESRVLESLGDAVIVTDANAEVVRLNRVAEALTGWSQADVVGVSLSKVFHVVDASTRLEIANPAEEVRRAGAVIGLANEKVLIRPDGSEVHIDGNAAPMLDDQGVLIEVVLVFRDISERFRAQQFLEQSERSLTSFADLIPTLAWMANADGWITWYNHRWYDYTGTTPSEMEGWGWQSVHDPEVLPAVMEKWAHSISTGQPFNMIFPLRGHDAVFRPFLTRVTPVRDAAGKTVRWFGINIEIDELEQTRKALQAEQSRLAAVLDHIPLGLIFADANARITGANAQVERLLRHPVLHSAGAEEYGDWISHHADGSRVKGHEYPLGKTLVDGGIHTGEYLYQRGDGTEAWVEFTSAPIRNQAGELTAAVVVALDTDDRRRVEETLRRSEKLAAVGQLAASIAHEINNPLESITNILFLLRDLTEGPSRDYVEMAERELGRVSAITAQSLRFHRQSTHRVEVNCNSLIEEALSLFQGRLNGTLITVECRYRAKACVFCLDGEIRQVLNNLLGNAIDVLQPQGGRLLLRSRDSTSWKTGKKGVVLTVADTGTGMSKETIQKIFEAFYTTKGVKGSGLGLWISKEIIDRHHGSLLLRSSMKPGQAGTVFSLFLPLRSVDR